MKRSLLTIIALMLIAALLASCGGGKEENTTDGNKIDINQENTTQMNNDQEESTTEAEENNQPTVDKNSDPGEHTYLEKNDTVYVMNLLNSLSFRSGTYEELGGFRNGDALRRIGISEDGRWSKVVVAGVEGYVATRNLTTYNPADNNFAEHNVTLTAAVALNVRISPNFPEGIDENNDAEVHCNVAGQIFAGTEVKVVAYDAELGWYKIDYTPAEGVLVEGYDYEFFVKASNSYFEETKNNGITIPEGYKVHSVEAISFAVPENLDTSNPTLMISQFFISIEKATFSSSYKEDFIDGLKSQGLNVSESEVTEAVAGEHPVYVVSCVSNPGASASYDTLICVLINDTECVNITVAELGNKTDIVDVIVSTITVND